MTWTKEKIVEMLNTNDKAVSRAVVAIYKRQTASERVSGTTQIQNNIGFNHADARYLTYCAEYVIKNNRQLSGKHLEKCRKRIAKYWKQLIDIANGKEAVAQ